jgi:hypothetical protein
LSIAGGGVSSKSYNADATGNTSSTTMSANQKKKNQLADN